LLGHVPKRSARGSLMSHRVLNKQTTARQSAGKTPAAVTMNVAVMPDIRASESSKRVQ